MKKKVSKFSGRAKSTGTPVNKQIRYPTFWSISRFHSWKDCPKKYFLQNVEKNPLGKFESNPNIERGIEIHKKFEHFFLGDIKQVPREVQFFKEEMLQARKEGALSEADWALDNKWKPCESTDWDRAYVRVKTDLHLVYENEAGLMEMVVVDLKTGKIYEEKHADAMELYALVAFSIYPEVRGITSELWYSDQRDSRSLEFKRSMLPKLKDKWDARARKMLDDRTHKATPSSDACRYCPFRADKGGPCNSYKT